MLTYYEAANRGNYFKRHTIPLGALVYYKPPKHRELPAFNPRTSPGIFVGWKVGAGYAHRKIYLVLDYKAVRFFSKGYGRPIQVYETETVEPTDVKYIFPLYEANMTKINLFQPSIKLPIVKNRKALPFEGKAPPPMVKKKKTYVMLGRAIKFRKTVGCKGYEKIAEGVPHTDEYYERLKKFLESDRFAGKARAAGIPIPPMPAPGNARKAPRTPASVAKIHKIQ